MSMTGVGPEKRSRVLSEGELMANVETITSRSVERAARMGAICRVMADGMTQRSSGAEPQMTQGEM